MKTTVFTAEKNYYTNGIRSGQLFFAAYGRQGEFQLRMSLNKAQIRVGVAFMRQLKDRRKTYARPETLDYS